MSTTWQGWRQVGVGQHPRHFGRTTNYAVTTACLGSRQPIIIGEATFPEPYQQQPVATKR